jgi:DNA-binding Lrp family transcriptional regulator
LARIGRFIIRDEDINRLKYEIIGLFKDNPGLVDSATKIAVKLGREEEAVKRTLEELTEAGICRRIEARPEPLYVYYASALLLERLAQVVPEMDYGTQMELVHALLARKPRPEEPPE